MKTSTRIALAAPVLLALAGGCKPFEHMPSGGDAWLDATWDPAVVPLSDGLYVRLPAAGALVRVSVDGEVVDVPLDGLTPDRLVPAPDGETLLVFGSYPWCDTDDPKIETVEDCEEEGEDLEIRRELALVRGGELAGAVPLDPRLNALTFSSAGDTAVAYWDFSAGDAGAVSGLENPTQVLFVDLATGETNAVNTGFSAERILFDADDTRAVVLSRSQVSVVELESGDFETVVTFPLSLDVDDAVHPDDVALTPDGQYALITVQGAGEVYVLDLVQESINIVTLANAPADMVVDPVTDRTVLVYSAQARVDVVEHERFDLESFDLEEPATDIRLLDGEALLYNVSSTNYHDVYRMDLLSGELVEYRSENPVVSMQLDPSAAYAVAVTRPEGGFSNDLGGYFDTNWGVQIFDLASDDSVALLAQSQPLGVSFSDANGLATALVLLSGVQDLLQLDLGTGLTTPVELDDAPLGIGALAGDGFYITHDAAFGLVSFLDPATNEITPVGGFAARGLLATEQVLPRQGQED